jgi:hypothetical protein
MKKTFIVIPARPAVTFLPETPAFAGATEC